MNNRVMSIDGCLLQHDSISETPTFLWF